MNHVLQHCGNFSSEVLKGLIGYGREHEEMCGQRAAGHGLSYADGYVSKEADLVLGGFLHRQAAQRAARSGAPLADLPLPNRVLLACQLAREHLASHGAVGHEHYRHWLRRMRTFARHRRIALPPQSHRETDYRYARRLQTWSKERGDGWPELRRAAGIHLVFSPDPRIWSSLRAAGRDERFCLRTILAQTMKEFSDWRRKQFGPGHSLGWVAGTHVFANGADRHPHIHVVILKRDEAGREVSCSVANLKGHQGRNAPDPLRELKRAFAKSVDRELEHALGPSVVRELNNTPSPKLSHPVAPIQHGRRNESPQLRHLARGLRTALAAMGKRQSLSYSRGHLSAELGSTIRLAALVSKAAASRQPMRFPEPDCRLSSLRQKIRERFRRKRRPSPGLDIGD